MSFGYGSDSVKFSQQSQEIWWCVRSHRIYGCDLFAGDVALGWLDVGAVSWWSYFNFTSKSHPKCSTQWTLHFIGRRKPWYTSLTKLHLQATRWVINFKSADLLPHQALSFGRMMALRRRDAKRKYKSGPTQPKLGSNIRWRKLSNYLQKQSKKWHRSQIALS